jgi:CBS domain-containing protein
VLRAGDLMTRDPVLVHDDITVGELCDLFQEKNINGAPVIDRQGRLVGVVAQDDIIYGAMGHPDRSSTQDATRAAGVPGPEPDSPDRRRSRRVAAVLREQKLHSLPDAAPRRGETPFWAEERRASDPLRMPVGAIMTSPAISAEESTPVADLCEVMWNLRIHRVPIVNQGKVSGIVSSMDLCRAILSGLIKV